jgi:anti-anti-sigma factor
MYSRAEESSMSHPPVPSGSPTVERRWAPAPFSCTCKPDGWGSVWIQLVGELDLATCPSFEQALEKAQNRASIVSIDLQEVTFVDCSGLRVIVQAGGRAAATGAKLILVGPAGQVERLLSLTGPFRTIDISQFDSHELQ